jgi:hypothetical protein
MSNLKVRCHNILYTILMKLELRELLQDIENLRRFAEPNRGNEIGQQLFRVLDFAMSKLNEEREKEKELMENLKKAYQTDGVVKF